MNGGQPCEVGRARAYSSACRLPFGVEHQHVPSTIGAATTARILWNIGREQIVLAGDFLDALQAALLGFENKTVLLVEVDPAM
jgi:hypothetical protein